VDLAISKLLAGRPKDLEFVGVMLRYGMVTAAAIMSLTTELTSDQARRLVQQLAHCQQP
jgi:hypothetical protein